MITIAEPAAAKADSSTSDPDHLYCCDANVAMCGLDLTGVVEVEISDPGQVCPLCMLVNDGGLPCPVPGCVP